MWVIGTPDMMPKSSPGEVIGAALVSRSPAKLDWQLRLSVGDQIRDVARRHVRVDRQHKSRRRKTCDRHEIPVRVEAEFLEQVRVDGQHAAERGEQGRAVRLSAR